jgi:hypothetical protein
MNPKLPLATALLLFTPACDKPAEPTTPPTTDSGATPTDEGGGEKTEPGAPGVPWAEKTFEQRQEYMGIVVLPAMKTMFKEYDENEFKQFKCQTCHGDDMNEKKFAMPSDSIYPLNKADPVKGAMAYDEKMTKFMVEKVVPDMAKLVDEEPDPTGKGSGFGCMECHPAE